MPRAGLRTAFLAAENLTEAEVLGSIRILEDMGRSVDLIGLRSRQIHVLRHAEDGVTAKVSLPAAQMLGQITTDDYDGVAIPASLLRNGIIHAGADVLQFIHDMQAEGKPLFCVPVAEGAVSRRPQPRALPKFNLIHLLAGSWRNWNAIEAPRLGAALAYYTLLSLAPLMILIVAIARLVLRRGTVEADLVGQISRLMGNQVADTIRGVLANAKSASGLIAGALSIVMLLIGASGVFLELRASLDTVWGVKPADDNGPLGLARSRAFAFVMILGTGVAVLILLLLSTILSAPAQFLMRFVPANQLLMQGITALVSLCVMTLIFAVIYKVIPDVRIRWSDVWIGAFVTSVLFTTGKFLIAWYLANASVGSLYAAAGSIIVFLTWVYYSAQIFLFGAEFTHVYTLRHGSHSKVPQRMPVFPGKRAA